MFDSILQSMTKSNQTNMSSLENRFSEMYSLWSDENHFVFINSAAVIGVIFLSLATGWAINLMGHKVVRAASVIEELGEVKYQTNVII